MRRVNDRINLLDLPEIVVEKIMGYMSYEEVAHLRIVSGFDVVLLNPADRWTS